MDHSVFFVLVQYDSLFYKIVNTSVTLSDKRCHSDRKIDWHSLCYLSHIIILFIKFLNSFKMAKVNKLKITPLADRVIVKAAAAEEKTSSGIIIPDTAKEKPSHGVVMAVGTGKKDEPMTVKSGDKVLYGKYAGTEIKIEGEDYLIMRESDIFAIV